MPVNECIRVDDLWLRSDRYQNDFWGDGTSGCAQCLTCEPPFPCSPWHKEQGPAPGSGSREDVPAHLGVQGAQLSPQGVTGGVYIHLGGVFPSRLFFPSSRACSQFCTGLHPTCPVDTWSLAADIKSWELKKSSYRAVSWPAELSRCFLHCFLPLPEEPSLADLSEHLE